MNHKAFTLIELLVVVLIIGILSAIALPQYTQAVEKSRAAEALSNIGSFKRAVDIWKLGNPGKHRQFTPGGAGVGELDIGIPDDWEDKGWAACSKNFCYVIDSQSVKATRNTSSTYSYKLKYWFGDGDTPYYECFADNATSFKLCKALSDMKYVHDSF